MDSTLDSEIHAVSTTDNQQYGLFALYDPPYQRTPEQDGLPQDTRLDIVAIHGVNGNATQTWTHANGKCWLRDFLPVSIPQARIYAYGYPAKLTFSRSFATIEDFSRRLLVELSITRTDATTRSRPLIFLCHSMGGIVFKKAMVTAADKDESYGHILKATRAVFFFGTPHRGSAAADLPQVLADIANLSLYGTGRKFRSDLLGDLKVDSPVLIETSNSFRAISSKFNIVSLYETQSTGPMRTVIVQQASAVLNLPNEEPIPLHANHRDMCRFDSTKNKDYLIVLFKLIEFLRTDALGGLVHQKQVEVSDVRSRLNLDESVRSDIQASKGLMNTGRIRQWLRAADCESIRREKRNAEHTCEWIQREPKFAQWLSCEDSKFLWMYGIPGSGKTVLASYIIEQLSQKVDVLYFFCRKTDPDKRSVSSILRTLASQALGVSALAIREFKFDETINKICAICDTFPDPKTASIDTQWKVFELIVKEHPRWVLVIDGLDECDSQGHSLEFLTSKFKDLTASHAGFRVLIISRNMEDMRTVAGEGILELFIRKEDIQSDIRRFVEQTVTKSPKLSTVKGKIIPAVSLGSDGMFLWAHLMLENLKTARNLHAMMAKLERMPTGLSQMYRGIIRDIAACLSEEEQKFQRMLISWIVTAFRPLRLSELQTAVSITQGVAALADDDLVLDIRADVQKLCGPLVFIMDDQTIQLIHVSVLETICEDMPNKSESLWTDGAGSHCCIEQSDAHLEISKTCLTYLSFAVLGSLSTHIGLVSEEKFPSTLAESLPFLEYAASNWHDHIRKTNPNQQTSIDLVQAFLESANCFAWLECYSFFVASAPGEFGHHFQVQSALKQWIGKHSQNSDIGQVLENYFLVATEREVELAVREFGLQDLRTLAIMGRMGCLYAFLDRHAEAMSIRATVYKHYMAIFGAQDIRTRKACTDLGYVTYMLDDHEQAEELFYKALGGRDEAMWKRDVFDLETMKELGTVYWLQRRNTEAVDLLQMTLNEMIKQLTEHHRLTVLCRQYLAVAYRDMGKIEKALEVASRGHEISIEIQGEDHPDSLRGALFIANLEIGSGNLDAAEVTLQDLLDRQRRVLGSRHADTYWTLGCLGRLYMKLIRNEEAEVMLRAALQGIEGTYERSHSSVAWAATGLSDLLKDSGRNDEAEEILATYDLKRDKDEGRN